MQTLEEYGVDYTVLTGAQLRELEPHLSAALAGAIHFRGSPTSSDPGMLTKAYADHFTHRGGRILKGDARQLDLTPFGLEPGCRQGLNRSPRSAGSSRSVVRRCFRPLGYDIPLAVKRGYHMHYGVKGNAILGHSVGSRRRLYARADEKGGPPDDRRRVRRSRCAAELCPAPRDEPLARELFPLAGRLDPEPWMGCRPCLPDMVPVIGKGERHQGLWFAFWSCPSRFHAWTGHRAAACRNDDQ